MKLQWGSWLYEDDDSGSDAVRVHRVYLLDRGPLDRGGDRPLPLVRARLRRKQDGANGGDGRAEVAVIPDRPPIAPEQL